jgi:hypothetical protein
MTAYDPIPGTFEEVGQTCVYYSPTRPAPAPIVRAMTSTLRVLQANLVKFNLGAHKAQALSVLILSFPT